MALGSAAFSIALKMWWPLLPFIDRVGLVFLLCVVIGIFISMIQGGEEHPDAIDYAAVDTSTSPGFNFASLVVILMLTALYVTWW